MLPSEVYGETGNGDKIYDFELVSSSGARQVDTNGAIERWDRRILQSICSDVLLVGGASVGSYSLASTKAGMFQTAIISYLDTIKDQMNEKAIPMLMEANGKDGSRCPKLVHNGIEKANLKEMAEFVKFTTEAGALTPDAGIESELRDMAGFPQYNDVSHEGLMDRAKKRQSMFQDVEAGEGNGEQPPEPPTFS